MLMNESSALFIVDSNLTLGKQKNVQKKAKA